jgi:hypothetical protein
MSPRKTDAEWRALLASKTCPPPEGEITDARWIARSNDWYVRVGDQWYWLDSRGVPEWKATLYGP